MTAAPASDAALVSAIVAGDERAFVALMRRFNQLLYRTARSILKDDFEAEDAVQNAYLLAYREIGKFRGEAKLSTWLVRIVVNEALRSLRSRSRLAHVVSLADDDYDAAVESAYESVGVRPERPDEAAMRSDLRRALEQAIDALPLPRRAVFMLRAVEELSVAETAAVLEIPEATVRTRFFRARTQLAAALSPEATRSFDSAFAFAGDRCNRIVARVLACLRSGGAPRAGEARRRDGDSSMDRDVPVAHEPINRALA